MTVGQEMTVKLRVFAGLQHLIGEKTLSLSLPEGADVGALRAELVERFPILEAFMTTYVIAVGEEVQDAEHVLHDGDLVDLIPPISGG